MRPRGTSVATRGKGFPETERPRLTRIRVSRRGSKKQPIRKHSPRKRQESRHSVGVAPRPRQEGVGPPPARTRYLPPVGAACATMCLAPCSPHDTEPHNTRLLCCPLYPVDSAPLPFPRAGQSPWRASQGLPGQGEGCVQGSCRFLSFSSDVVIQMSLPCREKLTVSRDNAIFTKVCG